MSSPKLSRTPLAARIRKATRAALRIGILEVGTADTLLGGADALADVESMHAPTPWSAVPASWRHAAVAVAQLECELAEVATRGTTLWQPVESAALLRLAVAVRAFPAESLALLMGMTLDIDEDAHHSIWIGVDGDAEQPGWTAPVLPAPGESLVDCVLGFRRDGPVSRH